MLREIIPRAPLGAGAVPQPRAGISWVKSSPAHLDPGWMEGGSRSCYVELGWMCSWSGIKSLPCQPSVLVGSCPPAQGEGWICGECRRGPINEGHCAHDEERRAGLLLLSLPEQRQKSLGRDPSQSSSALLSRVQPGNGATNRRDFVRLGAVPGAYFGS